MGRSSPPALDVPKQRPTDNVNLCGAHQEDGFRLDWGRAALTSLSLLAGSTGAAIASPTLQAQPRDASVDLTQTISLEDLKESIRESFGRAPRSRREAYQRLDALQERGILDKTDRSGTALMDCLHDLNTQPLARGINRRDLLLTTLRQLDNPELMKQGERGACAAAGLQHVLAERDPLQYVNVVSGLTSPQGVATLDSGVELQRVEDTIRDDSDRDVVSRLMQSALIEYGNGSESYSNREDLSTGTHDPDLHQANPWMADSGHRDGGHSGLYPNEITRVLDALFPGDAQTHFVDPTESGRHLEQIRQSVADGKVVLAGLLWDEAAHLVVIKSADDGHLTAWNPWGESGRQENRDPFDNWGSPMPVMMAPTGDGPEREELNETGRFKISEEAFEQRLLVYEVGG